MIKTIALRGDVGMLALLLFTFLSYSQNNFKVTGKVTDESGKPIEGVSVQVKGTRTGATPKLMEALN